METLGLVACRDGLSLFILSQRMSQDHSKTSATGLKQGPKWGEGANGLL